MAFPRIKSNFSTCQMNDNNRDILNCLLEFSQQSPFLRISDCYYSLNSTSGICGLSLKPNIDSILLGSKLYDHNYTILLTKTIFHEQYLLKPYDHRAERYTIEWFPPYDHQWMSPFDSMLSFFSAMNHCQWWYNFQIKESFVLKHIFDFQF